MISTKTQRKIAEFFKQMDLNNNKYELVICDNGEITIIVENLDHMPDDGSDPYVALTIKGE